MDRERRVRMQLVIRNFLQRAFKGAFPTMETYSYFRGSDDHGQTCLSIPAMGLILATNNTGQAAHGDKHLRHTKWSHPERIFEAANGILVFVCQHESREG